MKKIASNIKVSFYNQEELINIYSTFLPETQNQIEVYLIENFKYLSEGGICFTADASSSGALKECQRFIFLPNVWLKFFQIKT